MASFFLSSLRARLTLLIILAVLPPIGLIVYTTWEQKQLAADEAQETALRVVRLVSANEEKVAEAARQILLTLAKLPEIHRRGPQDCSRLLSDLLTEHPSYANLGVIDTNGDLICSGKPFTGPVNLLDRTYFQRALERRDFVVGEYQIGRITGKATINFAYPVLNSDGNIQSVVYAALDLAWINKMVGEARLPEGSTVTVVDRQGVVLARIPDPEPWIGKSTLEAPIVKSVLSEREGTIVATGLDGVERLYAFTALSRLPENEEGFIWVGIPKNVAFADVNRISIRNFIALGLVTLLIVAAVWLGGGPLILRRVRALVDVTKRLAGGDLDARTRVAYAKDEIGDLARAFDVMAETLQLQDAERKASEEALRHSEQRYRSLVESAADAIFSISTTGSMVSLNPAFKKITGWEPSEWIGKHFGDLVHPDDFPTAMGAFLRTLQGETPAVFEIRILTKSGAYIAGEFTATPQMENGQVVEILGIGRDISQRKELFRKVERRTEELSALYSVAATTSQSLDLDSILEEVVRSIGGIFQFDAIRIYLLNEEMDRLVLKAAVENHPDRWPRTPSLHRGEGVVGAVAETGEAMVFEDLRGDPRYEKMSLSKNALGSGSAFLAVFPIKSKLCCWGSLSCIGGSPRRLSPDETSLLTSITHHVGIAIENATLFQQTATRAKELSALYSVAGIAAQLLDVNLLLRNIMHKILEIFSFDAARIYLVQSDKRELRLVAQEGFSAEVALPLTYQSGEGIVGKVLETGEPRIFEDIQDDPEYQRLARKKIILQAGFHSSFFIPIKVRGETLGVMNLLSNAAHHFSPGEVQIIHSIAYHLGIAVGNATLLSQLKQKTLELERANRAKDEFLSVMSHELRTPLNVITGYTAMFQEGVFGESNVEQKRVLTKVLKQTHELLSLVNGILQVTSLQAGAVEPVRQSVHLVRFLDELREFSQTPADKTLALRWDYSRDLPVVWTDEDKLKHILQNLIQNAIKFTEKGEIRISAKYFPEQKKAQFKVADTGIGIPKEKIPVIFEMFQQLDSSETRNYGGTGLGLYIVKKFTELLAGEVEVESEPGHGSTFTVTIFAEP